MESGSESYCGSCRSLLEPLQHRASLVSHGSARMMRGMVTLVVCLVMCSPAESRGIVIKRSEKLKEAERQSAGWTPQCGPARYIMHSDTIMVGRHPLIMEELVEELRFLLDRAAYAKNVTMELQKNYITKRDVSEDDAAPFHLDQMPHAEKATEGWLQAIRLGQVPHKELFSEYYLNISLAYLHIVRTHKDEKEYVGYNNITHRLHRLKEELHNGVLCRVSRFHQPTSEQSEQLGQVVLPSMSTHVYRYHRDFIIMKETTNILGKLIDELTEIYDKAVQSTY